VSELIKQFAGQPHLDRVEGGRAFFLIALGLLKKALIADYLAESLVNRVFDTPKLYSGAEVLIAVCTLTRCSCITTSRATPISRAARRNYWASPAHQFRPALHGQQPHGLLEELAHQFFELAARLPLLRPPRRADESDAVRQPGDHEWSWAPVAWSHLDFAIWGLLHGTALALTRAFQVRRAA